MFHRIELVELSLLLLGHDRPRDLHWGGYVSVLLCGSRTSWDGVCMVRRQGIGSLKEEEGATF